MGDKLAKKIDAVYKAALEQSDTVQNLQRSGEPPTAEEAAEAALDATHALHAALIVLARELPDLDV